MKDTESRDEIRERGPSPGGGPISGGAGIRLVAILLATLMLVSLAWSIAGRATSKNRRLAIRHSPLTLIPEDRPTPGRPDSAGSALSSDTVGAPAPSTPGTGGRITLLTWNIAHGRGDVRQGWINNWKGGSPEVRVARLAAIIRLIRQVDPDLVILNEVDFSAQWSGGLNQAEVLALGAGYHTWVEQRNFDFRLPFLSFSFGNVLLSRYPILGAEWLDLPRRSGLESTAIGTKAASVVRVATESGSVSVVPIHLEFRGGDTRLRSAGTFARLMAAEENPLILAGDFNTAPSGWPAAESPNLLDSLLALGWDSPRARATHGKTELTFPTPDPQDSRDWILVEPPLKILESRVLSQAGGLSDHFPVLAVLVLPRQE